MSDNIGHCLCPLLRRKDPLAYIEAKSFRGQEKISSPGLWVGDPQLPVIINPLDFVSGLSIPCS